MTSPFCDIGCVGRREIFAPPRGKPRTSYLCIVKRYGGTEVGVRDCGDTHNGKNPNLSCLFQFTLGKKLA